MVIMATPITNTAITPPKTLCPKCKSEKVTVEERSNARGVANSDRGPVKQAGHYRKADFRCLDCNHRWREYFA